MDSLHGLVSVHVNMGKLEKEIKKCRRNLIKGYVNNDCSVYILKISYTGFAEQLKKETAKFDKLLQDLYVINDKDINDERSEIMDNIESDSESTGSDREFTELLYRDSVAMTDSLSIDETQIKIECDEKKEDKNKKGEIKPIKPPIKNKKKVPTKKSRNDKKLNKNVISNTKQIRINNVPQNNVGSLSNRKQKKVEKILNGKINGKNNRNNRKLVKMNNIKPIECTKTLVVVNNIESVKVKKTRKPTTKPKTGYNNMRRKGFEIYKNASIYGSTLLFCNETCGGNKSKLRKYLIKYGDFNKLKIEEIQFKTSYNNYSNIYQYALIRVRGPLDLIKEKMNLLNNKKGDMYENVMNLFEKRGYNDNDNDNNNKQKSKVLYVNNFDILDEESHKRFTDLFGSYGELKQHIVMGLDKNKEPFAIVTFKHLKHAKEWVAWNGKAKFDGKILNISYSKW